MIFREGHLQFRGKKKRKKKDRLLKGGALRRGVPGWEIEHNNTEHHITYVLANLGCMHFIWRAGVLVNFVEGWGLFDKNK